MKIKLRHRKAVRCLLTAVAICVLLCGCDGVIYDGEGDCSVHYKVRFCYDYNMKYADAFAHEVSTITLYLLDDEGNVVWQKTESGGALAEDGYAMDVDVDPGQYNLLAWGGTDDYGSFTFGTPGTCTDLICTLDRQHDVEGNAYVDTNLDRLFHGYVSDLEFTDYPGTYYYTVPLVKNTNDVRVELQQETGIPINSRMFSVIITDNNGKMDWDNNLMEDEDLTYYAWHIENVEAEEDGSTDVSADEGIETDTPAELRASTRSTANPAVLAELTVCRLVKGQDTRLTVLNNFTGETVLSIPFIQYALMVKDFYSADIDDQEFLDRQDKYEMVFFVDEDYRWINTYIYINSWRIVLQNTEL